MRFLALFLALLPVASAASPPRPARDSSAPRNGEIRLTAPDGCRSAEPATADAPGTLRGRRLGELPPGRLDLAVMREVGGCPEPVTIRENYGAVASRPAKR